MSPIYLDHNATTPIAAEVVEAMLPYLREHFGNPSSGHRWGLAAREGLEEARRQVASLVGAAPEEIVFTSGGTEASNLAIFGVTAGATGGRVVTSVIEHPATSEPCRQLAARGLEVVRLPVDAHGRIEAGDPGPALLTTVMLANNETGVLQPVAALRREGTLLHTDAAQAVGKVPVDVGALGVDLLTIAGHKLYAPKGVGALYVRRGVELRPFVRGAGHEGGLRPGTENVASIVGLGAACALAERTLADEGARQARLRDALAQRLAEGVPGLVVHGAPHPRLPNTLSVRFPDASGRALLAAAPALAASTGSACHEDGEAASAIITAMGVDPVAALGTVRLSLGRGTTEEQIARAADALVAAWRQR